MRTSWPPTKQLVLSYSLRSAFVREINFSLWVHIFIWARLQPEGGRCRRGKKHREGGRGGGGSLGKDIMLLHHLMTLTHVHTMNTQTYGKEGIRRGLQTRSVHVKSERCCQTVTWSKRSPPSPETKKCKDEQMDEGRRSVESCSSFLPSTTRVVTTTAQPSLVWKLSAWALRQQELSQWPKNRSRNSGTLPVFQQEELGPNILSETATTGNYNVCASLEKTKKWYIFGRSNFTESCSYRKALMMHLFIFDVYVFRSLSKRHFVLILGPGELAGGTPILLIKLSLVRWCSKVQDNNTGLYP